tara:strand:- start:195 stop:1268 length:1074 start_codon:yes stop_codon:yes gene_type:complete
MLVRTGHRGLASGCDIEVTYTSDEQHANLYSKAVAAGWVDGCNLLCTINSGVDLYSTDGNPGFQIGIDGSNMGFTSGTEITIINNGNIWGASGSGGSAGTSSGQAGGAGNTGGTALRLKQSAGNNTLDGVIIHFTNNGNIKGGGGGGGGGGCGTDYQSSYSCTEYSSWYSTHNSSNFGRMGCDGAACSTTMNVLWWGGSTLYVNTLNGCGCAAPPNYSTGGYTYHAGSLFFTQHNKGELHFMCDYAWAVRRSWSSTCYTQHTHGDGGSGGTGADWDSSATTGNVGSYGSPNGNGTEDGGTGGTGGDAGVAGWNGNQAPNGGAAGGAGGAAGYYLNYNVSNTSGWTLVNNGTVAGQVG